MNVLTGLLVGDINWYTDAVYKYSHPVNQTLHLHQRKKERARNEKRAKEVSLGTQAESGKWGAIYLVASSLRRPPMPYNLFFSEVYSTVLAANPKVGIPG